MAAKRLSPRCSAIPIAPPIAPSVGSVWLAIRSVYQPINVRCGSIADIAACPHHVRFTPESGHREILLGCPLCANSRYYAVQQSIASIGACTAEFWPVLGMGCKAWGTKTSVLQYLGQEQLRALATWCAEKIRGRRVLDDFAFVHEHHSIRNLTGKSHFVRNHNHS